MKKTLTAFVAAATMASAIAAMPTAADARCDGCAVGAGVLGGLVAGAIIGGAVANARPAPVYVEPAPVYAVPVRTCLVEQQVWSPRYQAYVMRPVRVACCSARLTWNHGRLIRAGHFHFKRATRWLRQRAPSIACRALLHVVEHG